MKTLILGLGRQGSRILELLIERDFVDDEIYIFDKNSETLRSLKDKYGSSVEVVEEEIFSLSEIDLTEFLNRYNYIIDALPAEFSYKILKSAAKTKTATVSVSFLPEDFTALDSTAKESESLIVPDCGVAPGLSHLIAGYSVNELGGADSVIMKLGAIPQNPEPPFYHNITWSAEDLIEEYIRPAKFRSGGKTKTIDPFEDISAEEIFGIKLESFITDGARSFLTSFPDVPNVEERTLRHIGHLEFMKIFKESGFLETNPITVEGKEIRPYRFLAKTLEKQFRNLPPEDMFIMEIIAQKSTGGTDQRLVHKYEMLYDSKNKIPALVNSVAITAVQTLLLIHDKTIEDTGVRPLELLAGKEIYNSLIKAHKDLGAEISGSLYC